MMDKQQGKYKINNQQKHSVNSIDLIVSLAYLNT